MIHDMIFRKSFKNTVDIAKVAGCSPVAVPTIELKLHVYDVLDD